MTMEQTTPRAPSLAIRRPEAAPIAPDRFTPPRPARPPTGTRLLQLIDALVVPAFDALALLIAFVLLLGFGRLAVGYTALFFAVLHLPGHHRAHLTPRVSDDLPSLSMRIGLAVIILSLWTDLSEAKAKTGLALLLVLAFVVAGRFVAYLLQHAARAARIISEPTLIVGHGDVAERLAAILRDHPEFGLTPIGFIDDAPVREQTPRLLGRVSDLEGLMARFGARHVIVAFGNRSSADMVRVLRACGEARAVVFVVPRFFQLATYSHSGGVDDVWGIPLVRVRRSIFRPFAQLTKRAFDLVVASTLLILASPALAAFAIIVRRSSPGPVLFKQVRVGKDGRLFNVLKFRTMEVNDDSDELWTPSGDARVTRCGHFLRRASLDELPQLWNVVRGDMSLVGPRPERPLFVDRFSTENAHYEDRQRVPAGVTGWAQVHGLRGDTSIDERTTFDNYYIENWSLLLDLVILGRTFTAVIRQAMR
jgi:exopolysaccharide biosynthesis polyprenyl glycosylphosphotransferase